MLLPTDRKSGRERGRNDFTDGEFLDSFFGLDSPFEEGGIMMHALCTSVPLESAL